MSKASRCCPSETSARFALIACARAESHPATAGLMLWRCPQSQNLDASALLRCASVATATWRGL